ncbi:SDR family oxidoreductase [Chondrinema litorale]|uniref:SDR family oxidoreductase n=1 Tax=Chondrinema litorale TaxID=2994555 RepID=UPI002543D2DE|nr:SDR family oxidoreductase [Chondrinema litorale]UZR93311.1 SDR family oxidoreductase [Chondrinema litorale]
MMDRWTLKGKVALITGGTKGIGKAIVEELLGKQANVVFVARDKQTVDEQLANFKTLFPDQKIEGFQADVNNKDDINKVIDFIKVDFGKLDILVNNVGTNIRKPALEYEDSEIQHIFQTNLLSSFNLTMRCHELLKKSETGNVVFISSVAGQTHLRTGTVYAMTKAAMDQLTKNLAVEWAKDNIRVNSVAPWYIDTPLARSVLENKSYFNNVIERTPLGRIGGTFEVAGLVTFLCLPIAGFITGQCIAVDGGFTVYGF